ncbi:MAG: winged helix-turn-helix domain-containing protein [Bacteroidales bacterium]|nr:LysR family transcriptional regulator [Bacteroidota bacterium]
MAGPKGSKYYNIFLKFKVWLENTHGESILGNGKFELIDFIDQYGSLKVAADKLEVSYRKAWGMLREAEEKLGFSLVEKQRGGQHGGRSVLTDEGKILIEAYKELLVEFDEAIYQITKKFFNKVNK